MPLPTRRYPAADVQSSAHSLEADNVLQQLGTDAEKGLTDDEVIKRRDQYGPNQLRESERRSTWRLVLDQAKSVVLIVLLIAGILAFAFGHWAEGVAISAVFVVNGVIGFLSEYKAIRSMEALRGMGEQACRVRRGGTDREVSPTDVVPGDLILIGQGDLIPADARLLQGEELRVNEAALTGESVPVNKRSAPAEQDAVLAERTCMLFRGTTAVEGSGLAVVVAIGMNTEIGRVSRLTEEAEGEATPLQRRLDRLGRRMAFVVLAVAVLVALAGLLAGQQTVLMIETSIALGLAAIPEGLPIVATIALARGMWLMARRNALINRLTAVETLGATHVIFVDKTGTLTENRMTVRRIVTPSEEVELEGKAETCEDKSDGGLVDRVLEIGVLCNNATLPQDGEDDDPSVGDPMETGLLEAGLSRNIRRESLLERHPEAREESFDPDVMMMATYHETEDGYQVAVKGAPAAVLEACDRVAGTDQDEELGQQRRDQWRERTHELASQGLRLLAMADKRVGSTDAEPYAQLRFVGIVGMEDPPRAEVRDAIARCRKAGMRVVMVTGDQPETAAAIARQVGLVDEQEDLEVVHGREIQKPEELTDEQRKRMIHAHVFARVTPEQKLGLLSIYQDEGETVAMTGDGVNDAPALKQANIGVAMGKRGTDAARQVSDMILQDDAFSSIVAAVEQGRIIFGNIRKSVMFMLCTNGAEIVAVTVASLLGAPIPLRPLQILYLNVLTDVLPALALGIGKGSGDVMNRAPRPPDEEFLTRRHWISIGGWSLLIAACVLGGLAVALQWLDLPMRAAVTVSFLTLGFAKLFFVFNLRDRGSGIWRNDVVRNPWIWSSIGLCAVLLVAAVYLPGLSDVLKTRPIGGEPWLLVLALAIVPMLVGQILHAIRKISED